MIINSQIAGSGSGGGGHSVTSSISATGAISTDRYQAEAEAGDTVYICFTTVRKNGPTVTNSATGTTVAVTYIAGTLYSFTMPDADVTISG